MQTVAASWVHAIVALHFVANDTDMRRGINPDAKARALQRITNDVGPLGCSLNKMPAFMSVRFSPVFQATIFQCGISRTDIKGVFLPGTGQYRARLTLQVDGNIQNKIACIEPGWQAPMITALVLKWQRGHRQQGCISVRRCLDGMQVEIAQRVGGLIGENLH